MSTQIKTRKIKLLPVGETSKDKTKIYSHIKRIASDLTIAGNEVIRHHICNQYEIDKLKKTHNLTKGNATILFQNTIGTSVRNSGYQFLTKYSYISSEIRTGFNSVIYKTISKNFYDIITGKISIPNFRKNNINIPISANIKNNETKTIYTDNDEFYINFPLTVSERKTIGNIQLKLFFGRDRSNNKCIVNRILSGEYKLCDSSIQVLDDELFFLLTYSQPVISNNTIDPNKIMGVDVGINRPVSFYITNQKHQPKQIEIGLKIQHERIKLLIQRKKLQENNKYSKGGHGRNRKIQSLDSHKKKESNWTTLMNHNISSQLIKIAQENNVGIIKLENLTGITKNQYNYFLKSWKYYQLQQFIKYKAESVGIKVEYVDPKNTSITCPTCNTIDPENRSDKDKTIFKCQNFLCDDYDKIKDADIIGAINISKAHSTEEKSNSKKGRLKKYFKTKDTTPTEQ